MSVCAGAALSSCVSENFNPNAPKEGVGYMDLSVDVQLPPSTRADDDEDNIDYSQYQIAQNFPVELYGADGSLVESWTRASNVPASYVLPIGDYTVKAHTAGDAEPLMYYPYFGGEKSYTLEKDAHYYVNVICKMLNSSIKVNYSNDFSSVFSDWTITLVAGENTVITYAKNDGLSPQTIYWLFDEGITEIKVNFRGVLADGNTVTDNSYTLTKDWENEGYDDDVKYYTGGDAIVINFNPQESDEGKITGITINANVVFGEEEPITIPLNVEDVEPEEPTPDDPNDPDTPTPGGALNYDTDVIGTNTYETDGLPYMVCVGKKTNATTFEVSYGLNDNPLPQTEVIINTPHKLKKVLVSIAAGNDLFGSVTGGIQNVNLVTDEELRGIISEARPDAALPNGGEETYPFPVYAFYDMINEFGTTDPGKAHEFNIVVEDEAGNTRSATLRVIVNE